MNDTKLLNNIPEENLYNFPEIFRGFSRIDENGNVFNYGAPLIGLFNNYFIEDEFVEDDLKVIPYDIEREIYKEINHGFLIKETDDCIFCIGKVVDNEIMKLSDDDRKICVSLKIKYQKSQKILLTIIFFN